MKKDFWDRPLTGAEKTMAARNARLQIRAGRDNSRSAYGRAETEYGLARAGLRGPKAQAHPMKWVNEQNRLIELARPDEDDPRFIG